MKLPLCPLLFSAALSATAMVSEVSAASAPVPAEFYICASVNKNYVIGSKITTTNGVFRRVEPSSWEHEGYNDTTISSVAFDPRDKRRVYTSSFNGCWRSLDGGKTWRITTSWDMTEARDVVVDPFAPDNVYLALPDGIAHSSDGAQTWERTERGLPLRGKYTQVLKFDRVKAGRLFAGCETGIYLLEKGTWRRVLPTSGTVSDLQQSPIDPSIWITATQADGAWTSRDGGVTWTQFKGVPTDQPLYTATFDQRAAGSIAVGGWTPGILTSNDGGTTWINRNAGLPPSPRVFRLGVDPATNRLFASVFTDAIYASDDFGVTWQKDGLEGSTVSNFILVPRAGK